MAIEKGDTFESSVGGNFFRARHPLPENQCAEEIFYIKNLFEIGSRLNLETEHELLPWQSECLEKIKNERNVILSSPTGSGKTRVFLEWANIRKFDKENDGRKHTTLILEHRPL